MGLRKALDVIINLRHCIDESVAVSVRRKSFTLL
jgi:hypothetical protein